VAAQQEADMATVGGEVSTEVVNWEKVSAVLFDMDGVLCNSEELSRLAAVDVFADLGVTVTTEDFVPFMGTGNDLSIALVLFYS
jgi:phosphoglycolate phosphatase-like HAD superfamily hydrolase